MKDQQRSRVSLHGVVIGIHVAEERSDDRRLTKKKNKGEREEALETNGHTFKKKTQRPLERRQKGNYKGKQKRIGRKSKTERR